MSTLSLNDTVKSNIAAGSASSESLRKKHLAKFSELCQKSIDDQLEFFLKSFIFALGDEWKQSVQLATHFRKYVRDGGESRPDLNVVQASDFLQKYGRTRTATQRTQEIKDIDFDADNRISLIEYLMLHYKAMILVEYYKRQGLRDEFDLSDGAVGVIGVGGLLLDELFTVAKGMDPEVEKALEEFTAQKKARNAKLQELEQRAAAGGVKGMAAKNEIEQLNQADPTEFNRLDITLNAAKRRAQKGSSEAALLKKKQVEADAEKLTRAESRNRLAERAAAFGSQGSLSSSQAGASKSSLGPSKSLGNLNH